MKRVEIGTKGNFQKTAQKMVEELKKKFLLSVEQEISNNSNLPIPEKLLKLNVAEFLMGELSAVFNKKGYPLREQFFESRAEDAVRQWQDSVEGFLSN